MLLSLLLSNPMLGFTWLSALVLGLTLHEFAHALAGKWLGDDTAEKMGRLSLNPLAHIDIMGLVMLVAVGFGWAKPVPYDPRNLRTTKWGDVMIALAGPGTNLLHALFGGILFRLAAAYDIGQGTMLMPFFIFFIIANLMLALFNLIPIPPLDGSKVLTTLLVGTPFTKVSHWLLLHGNQLLLIAVLISIMTPIDPFFFIQVPAFQACDIFAGASCLNLLGMYLGG